MSQKKIFEYTESDLAPLNSFNLKDSLYPELWKNDQLDENVRETLLEIANDFYKSLELKAPIKDIILTGSLANYNWSEKYSDYDVHIVIEYKDVNKDEKLVEKLLDYSRKIWNLEHDITVKGFEVELYVQDEKSKLDATGVYSLSSKKWLRKPSKIDFKPDLKMIELKSKDLMDQIDSLENKFISGEDLLNVEENLQKVWAKIKRYRSEALEKEGEFSTGNLIFKFLRRNGYSGKVIKLRKDIYDKLHTLK